MLPLYFNYLSTGTLRVLQIHDTQCGLTRLTPEDMQYTPTAPSHPLPLELQDRTPRGRALRADREFRSTELGSLSHPPAQPGPEQTRRASHLSERCPREEDHTDGKIKAGRLKSHFKKEKKKKRLNSRLLYLLSVEINKVLGLQNCWFGDLDDARKGWGGVGWAEPWPQPGWAPRGCPAAVQGPAPVQSRASFALPAGAPARQGPGAVLRSSA